MHRTCVNKKDEKSTDPHLWGICKDLRVFILQMNGDIHPRNFRIGGRRRKFSDLHFSLRDVNEFSGLLVEEVMVFGEVRVEICRLGINDNFTQQPDFHELMERVVDGCKRHAHFVFLGFSHEIRSSDVAVFSVFEKKSCEKESLTGESESPFTDKLGESLPRGCVCAVLFHVCDSFAVASG